MADLKNEIRRRFLDNLNLNDWDDEEPRLDFGSRALPLFIDALEQEIDSQHRAKLVRAIWQFRDPAALPALGIALRDPLEEVWKDALDGFVTLACDQALTILRQERVPVAENPDASEKLSWIDEAIAQVIDEIKRKKLPECGPS